MSAFWTVTRGELFKLFARKRTYLGFAAFVGLEVLLLWVLQLEPVHKSLARSIEQAGYAANDYLSGLTLALLILMWTTFLLGALFLALVGGDILGKEVEDGTFRLMLCRPVGRYQIILAKAVTCWVYTGVLIGFISLSALATGLLQQGMGGLFAFAPLEGIFALHEPAPGLARYFLAIPLIGLSLLPISCLALFLSSLKIKPAAATVLALAFFFVDNILRNIPYLESLRDYFLTAKMSSWIGVFHYRIPWETLMENNLWLMGVNATLLLATIAVVENRDFKS